MREWSDKDRKDAGRDPLWEALGHLRDSDTVREARRYAAARQERAGLSSWLRFPSLAWPSAALAGALAAIALFMLMPRDEVVQTGVGEMRRATLADGTVVMLNTASKLRVSYGEHSRSVELLFGQARFDVAHDASRPFRVTAAGVTVTALGTAFDVIALPRRTAVTLIEGRVLVESRRGEGQAAVTRRVLVSGQQVALAAGELTRAQPAKLEVALAWQRQLVDLSSMTLQQALDEVNRYSEVKVVVADSALNEESVSGVFKAGDVEAVAAALRTYFGLVVVRRDEQEIVLGRAVQG